MISLIEPIYKTKTSIQFGWRQEAGAVSYNVYVGLGPDTSLLSQLASGVSNIADNVPSTRGKVTYTAQAGDVQTLLSIPSTWDFSNKVFYFAITFVDASNTESSISDSIVVEVPPVGIIPKQMKDDPTINRHGYVFSDEVQRWVKMSGSAAGAVITNESDFYKANITTIYTYDGTNLASTLSYPSDATVAGMPAKLTTYTYAGSQLTKVQITDSTV